MRRLVLAAVLCATAGAAAAQPTGKEVAPVTVFPKTAPPALARSYPAAGQAIPAGVLVLSVTFDQPMKREGFDIGPAAGGQTPHCLKTPRLLDDNRTFVVLCTVESKTAYALSLNATPQAARAAGGFRNVADNPAQPAALAFTTTDVTGPRNLEDALKAAGLRETLDVPVEDGMQAGPAAAVAAK